MVFDVETIKRKMLVKYPFFGSVVANVEYKEDNDILTAATDGITVYYNSQFLQNLSIDEQIFVFAHEICHIVFNHILRRDGKDKFLWNIATDAVINAFLKKDGLKLINGAVEIENAIEFDSEQLYEKLLKEKQQNKQSSDNQLNEGHSQDNSSQFDQENTSQGENINNSSNEIEEVGHDTHSMWEDSIKKHKEEKENDKKLENKPFNNGDHEDCQQREYVERKQKETELIGEKETFEKNKHERKKQLNELKNELSRQVMGYDYSLDTNMRNISNIGNSKPLIDWRYILKETIRYDVDWSYKNLTIEDGVIKANLEEYPVPETEILLDTSGSINEDLLKNFLRECKNILKHSRLKVGCFDTKFYGFHDIRNENDIENMQFRGGGGTSFRAATNAFTKGVQNKIIFTDGYADIPEEWNNIIWIVFGKNAINPNGGKVIQIDGEQLNKLCYMQQDNYRYNARR